MVSTLSRLSEPSTACLMCSGRLFRPGAALHPAGIEIGIQVEPELGGDHHLLAEGSEGFAHKLFVQERAVDLGGVEERDAAFHGRAQQRGHLLFVFGRAVGKAHPHAAEPEGRDFQIALSEFAILHCLHRISFKCREPLRLISMWQFLYRIIGNLGDPSIARSPRTRG